jgi:hypothetical protein
MGRDGSMEFKTPAHEAAYRRVQQMLHEIFGEQIFETDEAPVFGTMIGTAEVRVFVAPWGDDDAVVGTRSYVVHGTPITLELTKYLLNENDSMRFGGFALDDDDDIYFYHDIVASTVDKGELRSSVLAVGHTADKYDDLIEDRFGGVKWSERSRA